MVSAYRPNGQTQIKYQDLVKRVKCPRTPTRARPTSYLGGLNLPCRSATKIHLRVLLRADPTLVIAGVMYVVYKYMPVITAQVIMARQYSTADGKECRATDGNLAS